MRESGIDSEKIKRWAKRISTEDFAWLRGTVTFALSRQSEDVPQFIRTALDRSYDPSRNRELIRKLVEELSTDEIIWFCDNYKRHPQHEKRRASHSARHWQMKRSDRDQSSR